MNGCIAVPPAEIKSVRYKDGFIKLEDIRECFPNFDDPARTKELDLTRPYHSSLLRVPAFIFRTAALSTILTDDLGQSQSQFPMVSKFFTEDDPVHVRLLGVQPIMLEANRFANAIAQFHLAITGGG